MQTDMNRYWLSCGKFSLNLGKRTLIMGILNTTPDSFSDGGHFFNSKDAIRHAETMIQEGADIIDIGGESSRPFSEPVPVDEELRRVIPVIQALSGAISVPISIDTTKSVVARKAIEAGASIVNDISSLKMDPHMADVVRDFDVPVILMHMKGSPKTMQENPHYDDPVAEIKSFLETVVETAEKRGIKRTQIIVDPGIGFGKTFDHNLILLKHLKEFKTLSLPILVGASRKAFIRNLVKEIPGSRDELENLRLIDTGTQAATATAILNGAHIVRVHDVAKAFVTAMIVDAIKNVSDPIPIV